MSGAIYALFLWLFRPGFTTPSPWAIALMHVVLESWGILRVMEPWAHALEDILGEDAPAHHSMGLGFLNVIVAWQAGAPCWV
jgi:hypothetical protein